MCLACFQQYLCGHDVRARVTERVLNGRPHTRFGGEVDNHIDGLGKSAGHVFRARAVAFDQCECRIGRRGCQILPLHLRRVEGVEVVDAHDAMALRKQTISQMTADESGSTGDENVFARCVHDGAYDTLQTRPAKGKLRCRTAGFALTFRLMRYLITGGAGFIGSHLVERLTTDGAEVVVLDDFSTGRRDNIAPMLDRIKLIEGTILDAQLCARAVRGADYVLHQAAVPSVPRSVADPVGTHAANATGTLNMLMAAREAKVKRFVYAASSSAYGDTAELPKHEAMVPKPLSPYAVQKYAGECYCRAFYSSFGLPTVSLRYFNIFGPRQDPTSFYAAVIPKFISAAVLNEPPIIFGDGQQTRDFTNVKNAVHANLLATQAPEDALGEVYNVGCGARISVNELWRRIKEAVGATVEPRYESKRAGDVRDSLAALDRARQFLNYQPVVDFDAGLAETIAFFAPESSCR